MIKQQNNILTINQQKDEQKANEEQQQSFQILDMRQSPIRINSVEQQANVICQNFKFLLKAGLSMFLLIVIIIWLLAQQKSINMVMRSNQIKKQKQQQQANVQTQINNQQNKQLQIRKITKNTSNQYNINMQSTFYNNSHNAKYFNSLYQYLIHNKITNILQINSPTLYYQKYKTNKLLQQIKIYKYEQIITQQQNSEQLQPLSQIQIFDWINCHNITYCLRFIQEIPEILNDSKFGMSVLQKNVQQNNNDSIVGQLITKVSGKGLYFNQIKSLNLIKVQQQLVYIFLTKNNSQKQQRLSIANQLIKNYLAIQTVFKMVQNIRYLREWIGYHINIGVDKFFIYDNSQSQISQWREVDGKVTKNSNKYGISFQCFHISQEQMQKQWRDIWELFYQHIVYIKWNPRDIRNLSYYGQMKSVQDYYRHFKNVVKYTSFTDMDQLIFSPSQLNIYEYLKNMAQQNITSMKLKPRHFVSRFCSPNKRVTDIDIYFPQRVSNVRIWGPKTIGMTKYITFQQSIHQIATSYGIQLIANIQQLRINHYNILFSNIKTGIQHKYLNATKFQRDDSVSRYYGQKINKICSFGCSQKFRLQCPYGKEITECLNTQIPISQNLNLLLQITTQSNLKRSIKSL